MSLCVTVGTGQLSNPKYQHYYNAACDYLVPIKSGDTGENSDSSGSDSKSAGGSDDEVEITTVKWKIMIQTSQTKVMMVLQEVIPTNH